MDQITYKVYEVFARGESMLVTAYTAVCGCDWSVDMRGNVRTVYVCKGCLGKPDVFLNQLTLGAVLD